MTYYSLKAVVQANKTPIAVFRESPSFFVVGRGSRPYIEPTLHKEIFQTERPAVVLVSAVGATGKTALAEQLSRDTGLPLLDLSKHKPVGDNTLTGLLTQTFAMQDVGTVFQRLASGAFGVVVDGIDEGRSKTTEKAFEAFLDDIARLSLEASATSFVLLGRTQVVEDCWLYLSDKGVSTALVTICPFTLADAKRYIDAFSGGPSSSHASEYLKARDAILDRLGGVFAAAPTGQPEGFLSFIGYPPVLDAIATLLRTERNYHRLSDGLGQTGGANVETSLLRRIAEYILCREREEKVLPNIVRPLLEDAPEEMRDRLIGKAFTVEEQSVRLIAQCLDRPLTLGVLGDSSLDERYEAQLVTWLQEHPFVAGRQFRNAVFEALALATVIASRDGTSAGLLRDYINSHKHSYHLVYMLDSILSDRRVLVDAIGAIFGAAMEFRSVRSVVELRIGSQEWGGEDAEEPSAEIEVEVEISLGEDAEQVRVFSFCASVAPLSCVNLGPKLGGAYISVPCDVRIGGAHEIEMVAPVEIAARSVALDARALVLRAPAARTDPPEIIVESQRLESRLESIVTNQIPLVFALADAVGVSYPAVQYVEKRALPPADRLVRQKYFRLRRILMEFASHSRGALAKYRRKIEHERVLKNDIGRAVLRRLVSDGILSLRGSMYYLDPEQLSTRIGVSWHDLRRGHMPETLIRYLRSVVCA